jgi:hypothetical protein
MGRFALASGIDIGIDIERSRRPAGCRTRFGFRPMAFLERLGFPASGSNRADS